MTRTDERMIGGMEEICRKDGWWRNKGLNDWMDGGRQKRKEKRRDGRMDRWIGLESWMVEWTDIDKKR